ncbi:MAG: hypothetical protein AAGF48_13240 [Pseudomonadota bacterium]
MIRRALFSLVVGTVFPIVALSQGMVPTMDRQFEFCQDRPLEPEWLENTPVREGYKRLLIQMIYRAESYRRVADANDCSCETVFPPWEHAIQHFNDNYLSLEQFEAMQTREDYRAEGDALRQSVRDLCEAEGHW